MSAAPIMRVALLTSATSEVADVAGLDLCGLTCFERQLRWLASAGVHLVVVRPPSHGAAVRWMAVAARSSTLPVRVVRAGPFRGDFAALAEANVPPGARVLRMAALTLGERSLATRLEAEDQGGEVGVFWSPAATRVRPTRVEVLRRDLAPPARVSAGEGWALRLESPRDALMLAVLALHPAPIRGARGPSAADMLEVDGRGTGRLVGDGVWLGTAATVDATAVLRAPVYIAPGCHVGAGAVVGPHVVLGRGATVGAGARVRDVLVDPERRIAAGERTARRWLRADGTEVRIERLSQSTFGVTARAKIESDAPPARRVGDSDSGVFARSESATPPRASARPSTPASVPPPANRASAGPGRSLPPRS